MINALGALELFEHTVALKQHEATERLWALSTSAYPHCERKDSQAIHARAAAVADIGRRRKAAIELLDDSQKVRMIGGMLSRHGEKWARKHGSELAWLAQQGISRESAIAMHEQWQQQYRGDAYWNGAEPRTAAGITSGKSHDNHSGKPRKRRRRTQRPPVQRPAD